MNARSLAAYAALAFVLSACAVNQDLARRPAPSGARRAKSGAVEKTRLPDLWRQAEASGQPTGYLAYLRAAPESDARAGKARDACRVLLFDGKGGPEDLQAYLKLVPGDPEADRLRAVLERKRFEAANAASDPQAAALFADLYPGTPEANSLLPGLRREDFKKADSLGTRLAYKRFLERYPSSPESERARARLAALDAPVVSPGDESDLELLPRLRQARPLLSRLECAAALRERLRRDPKIYGAAAEEARDRLLRLAKARDSVPEFCPGREAAVPPSVRAAVAEAVHALAVLRQRQQALESVSGRPEKLIADAREIGERASVLADESEAQDLELEALYGSMPADPRRPDDTATKNAREALRRAKRGFVLAGAQAGKSEGAAVLAAMDRQADLLLEIIAAREIPPAGAGGER